MKITKSQLQQLIKEELSSIDESMLGDAYKSTIGDREQREVKRWWLKKFKDPKAKDVRKPKIEANIKAGIFGLGQYDRAEALLRDAEQRIEVYQKSGVPVIEKDFRVRGDKVMLADLRGSFLDVTGESWVPESISSGSEKNTDIDMDGDTDAEDVLQVAQAAAAAEEPENIAEGSRKMKITKKQLKQMVREELAPVFYPSKI